MVSHFAQAKPGAPTAPYRVSSEKNDETYGSITLAWSPLVDTGGVPATGFKLYSVDSSNEVVLEFDGTDAPEILETTVSGLILDQDYSFYVTGLNPYESDPSQSVSYRIGGRPTAVGAITEIAGTRTG